MGKRHRDSQSSGKKDKNKHHKFKQGDGNKDKQNERRSHKIPTGLKNKLFTGIIKRHPDGFGFFIPDDSTLQDVYIPRHSMNSAMSNDRVQVSISQERGAFKLKGEIHSVVERSTKAIVGKLAKDSSGNFVIYDNNFGWGENLKISYDGTIAKTANITPGDWVVAEIETYPGSGTFSAKITEKLGEISNPLNDIKRVVASQNIQSEFSKRTLKEVEKLNPSVSEKDFAGRPDLRKHFFVTIDGATAKDFDDAICVHKTSTGFTLWVAIADVSHYVKKNTALDDDAYHRGTSVYFPGYVIPMLPEVLSNELCSLNPHVDRLVMVAEIHFDHSAVMKKFKFYESVINSKARLTYGQAQELVDSDIEVKLDSRVDLEKARSAVRVAAELAKGLMSNRFQAGSLELELPETQIIVNEKGEPTDIIKSNRLFSHRLIEELMLAANIAAARALADKQHPCMYRVHDKPKKDALEILLKFLNSFGVQQKVDTKNLQKSLSKSLAFFSGKPQAQILNMLTLRSMAQAQYSPNNIGHFGLGFEFYAYFTSPIRRYPDLIVHRQLKALVSGKKPPMSEEALLTSAQMLSACEQKSVKAERQIHAIKKARYMQKMVGKEFDGIITSVTKFGIFVGLKSVEVDGLVHIDSLSKKGEKLFFDEDNLRLIAKRSGRSFDLGDPVRIVVTEADPIAGQVDFDLVTSSSSAAKSQNADNGKSENRTRNDIQTKTVNDSGGRPADPKQVGGRQPDSRQGNTPKSGHILITNFVKPPEKSDFDAASHFEKLISMRGKRSGGVGGNSGNGGGSGGAGERGSGSENRSGRSSGTGDRGRGSSRGFSKSRHKKKFSKRKSGR